MIKYYSSFLDKYECHELINLYNNSDSKYWEDTIYTFYSINLKKMNTTLPKFSKFDFEIFRVQMVDESINQVENFHVDEAPFSCVVFLNNDFDGGELIFSDKNSNPKISYTPKMGDMLYFTGDEPHKVNNCIGKRYTIVGFIKNDPLNIMQTNGII